MRMILEGIRVIDWTQFHAGPYAAAMLADLGAEVIHIEHPGTGDPFRSVQSIASVSMQLPGGRNMAFEEVNRNKLGMTLDIKHPIGREIMYKLVTNADVIVTNFRDPRRVGMDYGTLRRHNPTIIYALGTAFGRRGPDKDQGSFEIIGYARSGAMLAAGEEGMPPVTLPMGLGDRMTAVYLAYGILAALLGREHLGIGQEVTVSQLGAMIVIQGIGVLPNLWFGEPFEKMTRRRYSDPLVVWYRCKDDRFISLALFPSQKYWPTFCKAIGRPELEHDPRFGDADKRSQHNIELIGLLDEIFAIKTYAEWDRTFREAGDLIYTPINSLADLAGDEQVRANQYITEWDHPDLGRVPYVGFPVELGASPMTIRSPAPHLGEHTDQILRNLLNIDSAEIALLREQKVVR